MRVLVAVAGTRIDDMNLTHGNRRNTTQATFVDESVVLTESQIFLALLYKASPLDGYFFALAAGAMAWTAKSGTHKETIV